MPFTNAKDVNMYYEDSQRGIDTIVFAHGLLFDRTTFGNQINYFKGKYRCIGFDFRGHGKSEKTRNGYDLDTLTNDTAALINSLEIAPCHFIGNSMGGMVGMRLALQYQGMLKSLILINTSADAETTRNLMEYRLLNFIARWFGIKPVGDKVMHVVFGHNFLSDVGRQGEYQYWKNVIVGNDRYAITNAVKGVINREPIYDKISSIKMPTLILVGDKDKATPLKRSERLHERIKNSQLKIIHGAGHSAMIEEPNQVNSAIYEFLMSLR